MMENRRVRRERHHLIGRAGKRNPLRWKSKERQRQHYQQNSWQNQRHQQDGVGEQEARVEERDETGKRPRRSSDQLAGDHDHAAGARTGGGEGGGGVMTIEKIMHKCGQSLIKPSVVSAPMDFLTTEAEYIRVWQVEFSREALGKASGLPPARAFYALEVMLCAVGKEAGLGSTLLVDCGVGVLAARGRVVKFTFVQGTDSLEVVHREPPQGHSLPQAPGGNSPPASAAKRGGIHAFGHCYIPYTSQANKELALARSRETASLLRSLREAHADRCLPPQGVEGEEGMPTDDGVVETMRSWTPGVVLPTTSAMTATTPLAATAATVGHPSLAPARGNTSNDNAAVFKSDHDIAAAMTSDTATAGSRAKNRGGRITSPLRALRGWERGVAGIATSTAGVNAPPPLNPPPPPLMDVHARLRGSVLSPSPSPTTGVIGNACQSSPIAHGSGSSGRAIVACPPMGLEPTGVERLGSHYSPAAQALYLDLGRGRLAWREADGTRCLRPGSVEVNRGGGTGVGSLEGIEVTPWAQQRETAGSSRASRVLAGLDSRIVAAASSHHMGGKAAAGGGMPMAISVPPMPVNLPPNFSIDGRNGRMEEREALPSPSPLSSLSPTAGRVSDQTSEARNHITPVTPNDPRGSRTNPRHSTAGVRLTYARGDDVLLSVERDEKPRTREGERSVPGGVVQTQVFGPLGSGSDADRVDSSRGYGGTTAVVEAARAVWAVDSEKRHQAGFARYHYYLQCDRTLAESVICLQPPWKAGIVRKILAGLDRDDGNNPRGHDNSNRSVVRSDSSSDGDSCSVNLADTPGGKSGIRTGRSPAGTESAAVPQGAEATDDDPEEDEEGEDKFEVGAAPSSGHLAGSTMMCAVQGLEPARVSGGGGGTLVGVGVDGEIVASPTKSPAAASTDKTVIDAAKRQARHVTQGAGPGAVAAAGMPEIPDRFKAGMEARLGETCDAFQTSIRRAVLNYVLLDAGQRGRLGIPAVPPGFESEGWGWGKGRAVPESPPEWHRRFLRAKDAIGGGGQIAGSPVLLAAQALLARCRDIRLLRLPTSAEEIRSISWSPMTAEEFRSSQLRYLHRRVGRIRRLLYPGLSEAIKTRLRQVGGSGASGGSTTTPAPPPDGHVRRYLLAVNVMASSVLRGMVEAALSDLLDFFRIHTSTSPAANHSYGGDNDPQSLRLSRSDRDSGRVNTGNGEGGASGDRETWSEHAGLVDGNRGGEQKEAERRVLRDCPPLFKVFLEDRYMSPPTQSRKLTCEQSLRDLKAAVMDVVRGVVLCFADLPRVTYGCGNDQRRRPIAVRESAADEVRTPQVATPAGASDTAADDGDLHDLHDLRPTTAESSNATGGAPARPAAGGGGTADASPSRQATSKRMSLYCESDSSDGSSDTYSADGGDHGGLAVTSDSDSSSVWSLKGLSRSATDGLAMNGGDRGGDSGRGGNSDGVHGRSASGEEAGSATLAVLSPTEPLVRDTIRDIHSYLRAGSRPAKVACQVYQPFVALLKEEAALALAKTGTAEVTVTEKDLPRLAMALERYKSTAAVLRAGGDAAPVELPGRMVVVDCEAASRKLLQVSGDLRKGALQRVETTLGKLTSGVTKQARTAILRLGKRPRSTEEMMEAIECLRTTRAEEQVQLQQQQIWMGQLLDFVFNHGGLKHDMVVAVAGVHRVMVELATATEKAGKAIADGKTQLQKTVEKAKRRMETDVEAMQMRIAEFIESDGRPRDMSEKAAGFSKELDGLKAQAVNICEEEAKIDGYTSGVLTAMAEKVISSFQPYADVWSLVGAVGPFITTTARTPITTLDPNTILADHASMKNRLETLQKIMTSRSHAVPARATQESLRLLSTLEKDIPVIKALTNAHLKDRHWWQVSALVGVTVSWEHPTTLQQLNELDVLTDAKVEAILGLSEDADAEHELQESTAEVERFVSDEAVVRIRFGSDGDGAERRGGAKGEGAQEEGVGIVPMLDEYHLRKVLEKAEQCRKVVSEVQQTDAARRVAAAAARAAAPSAAEDDQDDSGSPPGIVETLETALSNLTSVSEAMLKCAELVVEIESELEETTADEADHEELLKDAVRRWQALLSARTGESLKDLVEVIEEELRHLEEVSEA
eukprot:g11926.t1